MKMTIKGIERVQYYSKKNDRDVDGVRFHVEGVDPNVVGSAVEGVYVSTTALQNMGCVISENQYSDIIGCTLDVEYNRFGSIASLVISD